MVVVVGTSGRIEKCKLSLFIAIDNDAVLTDVPLLEEACVDLRIEAVLCVALTRCIIPKNIKTYLMV